MAPDAPAPRWASATSTLPDTHLAVGEVAERLARDLGPGPVDLLLAFFTAAHVRGAERAAGALRERFEPGCLLGVSGHGVVSTAHEVEGAPAFTALAARLPGVRVSPFVLLAQSWAEAANDPAEFARLAPGVAGAELVLLFGDPFSLDVERVLAGFNRHAPGLRVVGGMASAGPRAGANHLFLNDWVSSEGGVAVALGGALRVDVIVSQGCRPVGPPLEVTRSQGNLVIELDGQPALERAEQVLQEIPDEERDRLQHGLYIGRPVKPGASGPGDYLIRNLLGADRENGVIAVGDLVGERERVRFHVRDAATARADLEMLLSPQAFDSRAEAALLFACNSRGRGLYGTPDGDIGILQDALGGAVPAAGMFCAGEVGPVGGKNFLHGHTASIALLRSGPGTPRA
jgi:small ligand-binding sensory domain FIST